MSKLIEWFINRWDCINNDIDIPFLDYLICYALIPILMIGCIVWFATAPIWGMPYLVYRFYWSERREE